MKHKKQQLHTEEFWIGKSESIRAKNCGGHLLLQMTSSLAFKKKNFREAIKRRVSPLEKFQWCVFVFDLFKRSHHQLTPSS